jgi:hypothetical protein
MVNEFHLMLPSVDCDEPAEDNEPQKKSQSFVMAECSCGNQWKLDSFLNIFDIYHAYEEADK